MTELFKLKRFWLAIAAVLAVVLNHFLGFDETKIVEILGVMIAALLGTSAGVTAGAETEAKKADE